MGVSSATFVATFLPPYHYLSSPTMSPSSVRNDGIKGVDTNAVTLGSECWQAYLQVEIV